MEIKKGAILKYTLLPGIWPRIKGLLGSGFASFSSLLALIFFNVGLLPRDHPYLQPSNFGCYGIRHVIGQAAGNLKYSWKHADQVIIFYVMIAGVIILFAQIALLVASLFFYPVFAGTFFKTFNLTNAAGTAIDLTRYRQDIAFVVLDRALGVLNFTGTEGFFNSCVGNGGVDCTDINGNIITSMPTSPTPFHLALHKMMEFYSMGISIVGMLIILYCVIAIIGETVVTGTPFGKRFNKAWFVPRLIMFFALIMPMNLGSVATSNNGINAAQFITLGIAKFGSNMATNAWIKFHTDMLAATETYLGKKETLIAKPVNPGVNQLTQFIYVAKLCMMAEKLVNNKDVGVWVVRDHDSRTTPVNYSNMGGTTNDYLRFDKTGPTFKRAIEFSRGGSVTLRFGELNQPDSIDGGIPPGENSSEKGYVEPTCGELTYKIESNSPYVIGDGSHVLAPPLGIQEDQYEILRLYMFYDLFADQTAYCLLSAVMPYDTNLSCIGNTATSPWFGVTSPPPDPKTQWPRKEDLRAQVDFYNYMMDRVILGDTVEPGPVFTPSYALSGLSRIRANYDFSVPPELIERGWAGAALWYNKIAEVNGLVVSSVQNLPTPTLYPMVMEQIAAQHAAQDASASWIDRFNPLLSTGKLADLPGQGDQYIASLLYMAYNMWEVADPHSSPFNKASGNAVIDVVNMLFGTNGLLDILDNNGVHPLASLSALGRGMVEAAVRNLFFGAVGQGIGGLLSKNFPGTGAIAQAAGSLFFRVGMIGFSIGFILYYILPMLPFIYFFFAFAGWVKSIFEALVAMPLWALAHIKIDGEGLPGPFATNGYFLLLEIFIRPTLIVFGFLSSISIFAAMVAVLNSAFARFIVNVGGSDVRKMIDTTPSVQDMANMVGPVDQLFYTVFYTILVYMIGLSAFKLVDMIPNSILRWMGVTVSTFHDSAGDPASELVGRSYRSVQLGGSQLDAMMNRSIDSLTRDTLAHGMP